MNADKIIKEIQEDYRVIGWTEKQIKDKEPELRAYSHDRLLQHARLVKGAAYRAGIREK